MSNVEASKQAMRCIANAILLIPAGRDNLVDIEGDEFCTRLYVVCLGPSSARVFPDLVLTERNLS